MMPIPSAVLVTIDCFRADHAGFLGYPRPVTPFLDALSAQSFTFLNAFAAGSPTYYSVPAILASRYPLALGRDVVGIAPGEPTLASVLAQNGFKTAAFIAANPYLSSRFGYDSGFDVFEDFLAGEITHLSAEERTPAHLGLRSRVNHGISAASRHLPALGRVYDELYFQYCRRLNARENESLDSLRKFPSAEVVTDHAIAWLKANSRAPFFLWLHLMDPHAPYFPKPEALEQMGNRGVDARRALYLNSYWARNDLDSRSLRRKREQVIALYDAGIRWADSQIARLSETLAELGRWNDCALAVTADHGEEFLDHGGRFHAPVKLTDELIHVPWLLKARRLECERRVASPVSLLDLAPTLLDSLNLPSPADFRGRSVWADIANGRDWERPLVTECVRGCTNPFLPGTRCSPRLLSVRNSKYKMVLDFESGSEQLFDLLSDPAENNPLDPDSRKTVRAELLRRARTHLAESGKSRDFDKRLAAQVRELQLDWGHPGAGAPN
jgi:arylsulfatase A-like enzyme